MKNKILSLIVILCTLVSIVVMNRADEVIVYFENLKAILININQHPFTSVRTGIKKNEEPTKEEDVYDRVKTDGINNGEQTNIQKSIVNGQQSRTEYNSEYNDYLYQGYSVENSRSVKSENNSYNESGEVDDEEYPESAAVFKVNAYDIEDKLSFSDKAKILSIASKISPVDYVKVYNYLHDDNEVKAIINTFSLLKLRLNEEDYKKIKDIASKFMDVDCIEKYTENDEN